MLIFRLFTLLLITGLTGCANLLKTPELVDKKPLPAKVVESKPKATPKQIATSIDPNVLFMLLTAELAGQRGQYEIALEGYLEAAKRVNDPRFAERAVVIAMYVKNVRKANEALALWLRQDPQNFSARKLAALLALSDGQPKNATPHVDVLLKMPSEEFEKSIMEMAAVLQKEGKLQYLADSLAELSKVHSDQAIMPYLQSILAVQNHDRKMGEVYLQKALALKPDWDKALLWQAQVAVAFGDFNKALESLRDSISKHPDQPKLKHFLAEVLIKSERYPEAIVALRDVLAEESNDYESQLALGLVYLQDKQYDDAEDMFNGLLSQSSWRMQASFYKGKLDEKRGDLKSAMAWYEKVNEGAFAFDASVSIVMLMVKENRYADAENYLKAMLGKFPKEKMRILLIEAEILNKKKSFSQLFALLTTGLAESPDDENLLYSRALAAERIGKLDIMESDFKKILVRHPNNFEVLNALGYSLASRTTRYAEAEQYLQKALIVKPDEPVIVDSYGWLQFKMGHAEKALELLRKAFAKQKENEIAAHLIEVLWVLGQKEEAKEIFETAIQASPDDEYLREVEQRILKKAE